MRRTEVGRVCARRARENPQLMSARDDIAVCKWTTPGESFALHQSGRTWRSRDGGLTAMRRHLTSVGVTLRRCLLVVSVVLIVTGAIIAIAGSHQPR